MAFIAPKSEGAKWSSAKMPSRAYRLLKEHVTSTRQVKNLSIHNAVQAAVSYKPPSGLSFARYTEHCGSYMPLGYISP